MGALARIAPQLAVSCMFWRQLAGALLAGLAGARRTGSKRCEGLLHSPAQNMTGVHPLLTGSIAPTV